MNLMSFSGLTIVAAAAITLSSRLYLRYGETFLRHLAKAIGFSYAIAFLGVIGNILVSEIPARFNPPAKIIPVVRFAIRFLAGPLLILAWYFFIRTILEMRGKTFRVVLRIGYLTLAAGTFVLFDVLSWNGLKGPAPFTSSEAETVFLLSNVLNRLLIFGLWIWAYVSADKIEDAEMAAGIRRFSAVYIGAYLLYGVGVLALHHGGFVFTAPPVLEFFMHLPPLVILWFFLRRTDKAHPSEPVKEEIWAGFSVRHRISPREQDVIRLLLEGDGVREIAEKLFISVPTVKMNISELYRKLGVKNRWQLIAMIRNYSRLNREQS